MFQFLRPLLGPCEPSTLPSRKDAKEASTFHSLDGGTQCDCGHPRREHKYGLSGRLQCTHYEDGSEWFCLCKHFTITLFNLPGRLTAEEIVDRATKKEQETALR